jgi:autotransporter-associated beta strand protein
MARATDFVWLASPAGAGWNETDVNWESGAWVNGAANNAVFGDSAEKAVSADAVTLGGLAFNADGYVLSGGPLWMHGGAEVGAGFTATLHAAVTNTVGLWEKRGAGTLVFDPGAGATNTFYDFWITNGTLRHASGTTQVTHRDSLPETAPAFWVTGGTLLVGGGTVKAANNAYSRVSEYGHLLITNGVVDTTANTELLNGHRTPGTITVQDAGVLRAKGVRISQNNNPAGETVINVNTGGVIRFEGFTLDEGGVRNGTVNFNGGLLVPTASVVLMGLRNIAQESKKAWSGIQANILEGGLRVDTEGGRAYIRHPLNGFPGDGGLFKTGANDLHLDATNSFCGGTVISNGGAVVTYSDRSLGAVPDAPCTNVSIVGAGGWFGASTTHDIHANRTFWIAPGAVMTVTAASYTQTVHGVIVCADTNAVFRRAGGESGEIVLDPGPDKVNTFGTLQVQSGTLVIKSGTNLVTCPNRGQNAPGLRVSGGTLLVGGGLLKTVEGMYANVDGGHLLVTNGVVDTTSCNEILNAIPTTGTVPGYVTVRDSGLIIANQIRISQSNHASPTSAVVTLGPGGTLALKKFYIDLNYPRAVGSVVFDGGTARARQNEGNFLGTTATLTGTEQDKWLTNIVARVKAGGAVFDTDGFDIQVKNPLLAGMEEDSGPDGGLVKRGAGKLSMFGANTYTGPTVVEAGTLAYGNADPLPPANTLTVCGGAACDLYSHTLTVARLGGGGTVQQMAGMLTVTGALAPGDGDAGGTLTLDGPPASIAGCDLEARVGPAGACGRLHVNGDLDLSQLTLTAVNPERLDRAYSYVIASCTGSLAGTFAAVSGLPSSWRVVVAPGARTVRLAYDFGTVITVR